MEILMNKYWAQAGYTQIECPDGDGNHLRFIEGKDKSNLKAECLFVGKIHKRYKGEKFRLEKLAQCLQILPSIPCVQVGMQGLSKMWSLAATEHYWCTNTINFGDTCGEIQEVFLTDILKI